MSTAEPVHVSGADSFQETVDTNQIVLVDFYADWCGPCQMLEPILEDVAAETDAVIAKIDVDENQALAGEHGVRSVPTIKLYVGGKQVEELIGLQEKETLVELVEDHS